MTYVNREWKCHFNECALAADGRSRSHLEAATQTSTCQHVKVAQKSHHRNDNSTCNIHPCSSILKDYPFPPGVRAEFEAYLISGRISLIQRVSSKSFVVVTTPSSESPLGLLHTRISSTNNFQCTCHKYKRSTTLASVTTAPKLSKRCTHFYLFLWGILSHESLKKEFYIGENSRHWSNNKVTIIIRWFDFKNLLILYRGIEYQQFKNQRCG